MMRRVAWVVLMLMLIVPPAYSASELPLDKIKLPPGFSISIYARDVPGARSMAWSPNGTLFVGTRQEGKVYALLDRNHDNVADEVLTLAQGLKMPNGVAFHNGALYVVSAELLS
jgi:glucose/arabinose dehydrogenase